MRSFDQAAQTYEAFGFIQQNMANWLAEWLPDPREGSALEIAAGTGFFTRHLLPWNGDLLVTDASPSMVEVGASKWPEATWTIASADRLSCVPVNWIFSSSFLQWVDEPVALLKHWKSRLRPGGHILAGLFATPTLPELYEVLPDSAPLKWRSPDEWEAFLAEAGLTILRTETAERVFIFPSALSLLRTLHGTGAAPRRRLSGAKLRQVIREYDKRFAAPGGVRSTWTFFRFEAASTYE